VNQNVREERLCFLRVRRQVGGIGLQILDLEQEQPSSNAALNRAVFVQTEVDARCVSNESKDPTKTAVGS
jgi:hypothetical protein